MGLIIWITKDTANLFSLTTSGIRKETIRYTGPTHPVETTGTNHPFDETDEDHFYHKVAKRLEKIDQKEWFLAGTRSTQDHFMNHLKRHHPQITENIVGSECIEKLTENQLIDVGTRFFKKFHAFKAI